MAVAGLTIAAAAGGAAAGCHPTGSHALDAVYSGALAALVTVASSRAGRATLLVVAVVGVAMSRGELWAPSGAALALAFVATFPRRELPAAGAFIGALESQVLLRWPSTGFHGLTAVVAAAAVAYVLGSAWLRSGRRLRRIAAGAAGCLLGLAVLLSAPLAVAALVSKGEVDRGAAAARLALQYIDRSDAPGAVDELRLAAADLASAHGRTGAWWTAGGELVPVVAQQRRAVVALTGAGARLSSDAAGEAGAIDIHKLGYHDGRVDLAAVTALHGPVAALDSQLASAQRVLAANSSRWLLAPIADRMRRLSAQLVKASNGARLVVSAVRASPGILGGDGIRHYLVAFMTPAETRGLGGYIGAYAVLTADDGRISITRSGPTDALIPPGGTLPMPSGPADYLARYGAFLPQDNFGDLSYSPDFPTVEDVISQVYPRIAGGHIDGVLALDPYAMAALLRFTGPISVPGLARQLTADNAAAVLLREQYIDDPLNVQQAARHDVLQEALAIAFRRLVTGSLPSPEELSAELDPIVREGRLLFWTSHPLDQVVLRQLGMEGSFPDPVGAADLLAVTIANAGNNKIDAYLDESISARVVFDPRTGGVVDRVAISFHNSAPSFGLPPYVIGSYPGSGLPEGTNELWMSVYTPLELSSAAVAGAPLSIDGPTGELGVEAYSCYVRIPSRSSVTVQLVLEGRLERGPRYGMTLRLQPLSNPTPVRVSVSAPGGWAPAPEPATGASSVPTAWGLGAGEVQSHFWFFHR